MHNQHLGRKISHFEYRNPRSLTRFLMLDDDPIMSRELSSFQRYLDHKSPFDDSQCNWPMLPHRIGYNKYCQVLLRRVPVTTLKLNYLRRWTSSSIVYNANPDLEWPTPRDWTTHFQPRGRILHVWLPCQSWDACVTWGYWVHSTWTAVWVVKSSVEEIYARFLCYGESWYVFTNKPW